MKNKWEREKDSESAKMGVEGAIMYKLRKGAKIEKVPVCKNFVVIEF